MVAVIATTERRGKWKASLGVFGAVHLSSRMPSRYSRGSVHLHLNLFFFFFLFFTVSAGLTRVSACGDKDAAVSHCYHCGSISTSYT